MTGFRFPLPVISLAALLLAAACHSSPSGPDTLEPARLIEPSAADRDELRRALSALLAGTEVLLAEDALTRSSVLVVERSPVRSLDHPTLPGRDYEAPIRFQLLTDGRRCFLTKEAGGPLEQVRVTCVAESRGPGTPQAEGSAST